MAALVGRNGDALYVLFDGAFYDLGHRPVMTQVDDLGSFRLEDAAHNINCCVVSIEKRGSGDQSYLMLWGVAHNWK